jgi:cyclic pyranopterin phosphate synthase
MTDDRLTHFDETGAARMVAVAEKPETHRSAVAGARVRMDAATLRVIEAGQGAKGDVLGVARVAAIAAAKATAQLVPLCHPVRTTSVAVAFESLPDLPGVGVRTEVHAVDRTGPEMEALVAASIAALTIYDMCKAIDRGMAIEEVVLLEKSGGKSGDWRRTP